MEVLIHRMSMGGRYPRCGAPTGNVSITGAYVTCPDCKGPTEEQRRAQALARLQEAAERRRQAS